MSNEKLLYAGIYIISVLISSISQVMLKIAAKKEYETKLQEYINPFVISAYFLFFGTTLLTMLALRVLTLSTGVVLESTGYIFVTALSFLVLREKLSRQKLMGIILILTGILVYAV